MSNPFFDHPILNSPYECPRRHWELDEAGQTPCSSTASNSKPAMRSTTISAAWQPTKSNVFAVRSWSAPVMFVPAKTSLTRNCSARS
jgi:hypothetical protein